MHYRDDPRKVIAGAGPPQARDESDLVKDLWHTRDGDENPENCE
jgi:hypothetical protein